MNNSVFGKTMENIRNRMDIRLRTDDKSAEKLVSKPNYERTIIFSEDQTLMYDFHYNYIKKKYGPKAKLLMTETDSLTYEIHSEDFFKDIREDIKEKFDTSNFENSKLPRLNKKDPGCLRTRLVGRSYLNMSDCAPNHMPLMWTVMNSKNVKV